MRWLFAAFVTVLRTPLIGVPGKVDFANAMFSVNGSTFRYDAFINAVISFVLVAGAIYFAVVVPMNKVLAFRAKPATGVTTKECPECLSSIPRRATRCVLHGRGPRHRIGTGTPASRKGR